MSRSFTFWAALSIGALYLSSCGDCNPKVGCKRYGDHDTSDGTDGTDGKNGTNGASGTNGVNGTNGINGKNGTSTPIITALVTIPINSALLPWANNNKATLAAPNYVSSVTYPLFFDLPIASPNTSPQNGWIDLKIENNVFCYQRTTNSTRYTVIYKKTAGALTGCDVQSDKEPSVSWTGQVDLNELATAVVYQIIPRDTKLSGVITSLKLDVTGY